MSRGPCVGAPPTPHSDKVAVTDDAPRSRMKSPCPHWSAPVVSSGGRAARRKPPPLSRPEKGGGVLAERLAGLRGAVTRVLRSAAARQANGRIRLLPLHRYRPVRHAGNRICTNASVSGRIEKAVWSDLCALLQEPDRLRRNLRSVCIVPFTKTRNLARLQQRSSSTSGASLA